MECTGCVANKLTTQRLKRLNIVAICAFCALGKHQNFNFNIQYISKISYPFLLKQTLNNRMIFVVCFQSG